MKIKVNGTVSFCESKYNLKIDIGVGGGSSEAKSDSHMLEGDQMEPGSKSWPFFGKSFEYNCNVSFSYGARNDQWLTLIPQSLRAAIDLGE